MILTTLAVRVLHVLMGVFWAGSIFFMTSYLDPSVREAGPEGGKVMGILQTRGMTRALLGAGTLTVLTGLWLLWRMSNRFTPEFMGSRSGILLSAGGTCAIVALLIGTFVSVPTVKKLGAIGARVASSGGPPSPEDAAEMAGLRGRLTGALRAIALLLTVAVVTMALGPHV